MCIGYYLKMSKVYFNNKWEIHNNILKNKKYIFSEYKVKFLKLMCQKT